MNHARRILVVEDVNADFELIANELVRDGQQFRAKQIDSVAELVEELDLRPPDVVLCDHGSAKWDSFAVLEQVRERNIDLPFIVVTGAMGDSTVTRVLAGGADDLVFKHQLSRLGTAVRRALRLADEVRLRRAVELERDQLYWRLEGLRAAPIGPAFLRICADCKKIPDPANGWVRLEEYFHRHHGVRFSHGICPECAPKYQTGLD